MEVKKGDDPFDDPWQKQRDAKKDRIEKNIENRMRNQERTGNLMKGTTMRTVKALKRAREVGREAGKHDAHLAGLPVDLSKGQKRGKELTKVALVATQRSTASLGKFDKMREGEPERKRVKEVKKRKFEGSVDRSVVNNESAKSLKVLEKVMSGGKSKEKDVRAGKSAKGETGYDYDFDDGLGPSSFRKKKGRAGMGKMKKITKKRMT
jgi:regulator of ribosome biosynthesis